MKKLLLVLTLALAGCSVTEESSLSDMSSNLSIGSAESKLGDLSGFTKYSRRDDTVSLTMYDSATINNVYINSDKTEIKLARTQYRTGIFSVDGELISMNNEIYCEDAGTYTLTKNATSDLDGYDAYTVSQTSGQRWTYTTGKWADNTWSLMSYASSSGGVLYIKEEGNTISLLQVNSSSSTYTVVSQQYLNSLSSLNMDTLNRYAFFLK